MGGLGVYRGLLANRPLSWLLLGEFISGIGDWLYIVAVFVVTDGWLHRGRLPGHHGHPRHRHPQGRRAGKRLPQRGNRRGGLAGAAVAGALVLRRSLGLPLIAGAVVSGLGIVALGFTTDLWLALLAIGVASAGALIIDVVGTTLFQRLVPNDLLGRGTGLLMAITTLTGAAGAFAMPVLLASVGPMETFSVSGVAMIVVSVSGILLVGRAATREPTPYEAVIARVAKLPLFAGVPGARLETAMHKLVEVPVAAGQAIVRQGEPADRFYIIERGSFTVSQVPAAGGEPVVLRRLGPAQVFGELGLLNASPRTATVTANEDGLLLALDGPDFLHLVGASGAFRGRLLGLYAGAGGTTR